MDEVKHIIWSNLHLDYDDWKEALEAEYPNLTEKERIEIMYGISYDCLDNERERLNIRLPRPILNIADLDLWHGREPHCQIVPSGNIKDCLRSGYDLSEWYVDRFGDLRGTDIHHDGTNRYRYRAIRPGVLGRQVKTLIRLIDNGHATEADITRLTKRLGDTIGAVYGWIFPLEGQL